VAADGSVYTIDVQVPAAQTRCCRGLDPSSRRGAAAAEAVTRLGLPAAFMMSYELKLDAPDVKVLTMHSSKGLDFPSW